MSKTKKVLRTVLVAGVLSALAAMATFSAFSSQTENQNNNVTAGTVVLGSNGTASPAYSMSNAKPGQSSTAYCITVNYTGSLDANVKLYKPGGAVGSLGQYVNLKVETGAQGTPNTNCSGFNADAGPALFDSTLDTFPGSYGAGVLDSGPGSDTKWDNGDAVTYRVTATLASNAPDSAQGATTGTHTLRFEAQNQ